MFIGLSLSFSGSLVTKCISLNNEQCKIGPTLIDLNHLELNYYPFMISLDKFKLCPRQNKKCKFKCF